MRYFVIFVIFGAVCSADDANIETPLPDYFKVCRRYDPARDECIRDSVQSILVGLKDGYEPMGILPIDPFFIDKFHDDYNLAYVKGSFSGKNSKVHGTTRGEVKAVRTNVTDDTLEMEIDLFFDKFSFEGDYRFQGGVNLFQLSTKGYFNITMIGVTVTWKAKGKTEERNGEKYMVITEAHMHPKPTDMKILFTNLFSDPVLNDAIVFAMNENWRPLLDDATPILKGLWSSSLRAGMNYVFPKVPFRRLMPVE